MWSNAELWISDKISRSNGLHSVIELVASFPDPERWPGNQAIELLVMIYVTISNEMMSNCDILLSWSHTGQALPPNLRANHLASCEPTLACRRERSTCVCWSTQLSYCFLKPCATLPTPPLIYMTSKYWRRNWPMSWWVAIMWCTHMITGSTLFNIMWYLTTPHTALIVTSLSCDS